MYPVQQQPLTQPYGFAQQQIQNPIDHPQQPLFQPYGLAQQPIQPPFSHLQQPLAQPFASSQQGFIPSPFASSPQGHSMHAHPYPIVSVQHSTVSAFSRLTADTLPQYILNLHNPKPLSITFICAIADATRSIYLDDCT
eukprot:718735_1